MVQKKRYSSAFHTAVRLLLAVLRRSSVGTRRNL